MEIVAPTKQIIETDKIALVDADYIKYLVVDSVMKAQNNKEAYIYENMVHKFTKERIDHILNTVKAKGYLFCFSGPAEYTFRSYIAFDKKYKGNRTYVPKYPQELLDKQEVVKYIRERFPSLQFKDLEADDVLSMLQDEETFIWSKDKDLLQIPGTHFDIKEERFLEVSKADAFSFLMTQMLTGDSVDNISGLKACGPVGAANLLTNINVKTMGHTVLTAYMKNHGLVEGLDCFVEAWNLLKLRGNRGEHFLSKYKHAFDTLRLIKNQK